MNDCNEWLLFHGTNERAAQEIAQGDFTMRLAGTLVERFDIEPYGDLSAK